jgi:hypothetical protein
MEPQAITETLDEIETLRRDTRRALQSFWFAPEVACPATAAVTGSILLASGLSFRRADLRSASQ